VRVALYRIAQEGIANAIRHSGATTIALVLEENDGGLTLRIEDNGKGFDTKQRQAPAGIGLRSIRDLADDLGGKSRISSGPEGTKLEVSVPVGLCDDQK
jgi:two-component system NarL family sensor kinase